MNRPECSLSIVPVAWSRNGERLAPRNRRVLIIVQDLPVPYDRRTWLEATTLARSGYTVSVICPKGESLQKSYERLDGIDIYRYAMPFEAYHVMGYLFEFAWCFVWSAVLSLRVAFFGRGFDAIHTCNPPETYWLLGLIGRFFGKRLLFDHHDLSPEMYEAKYKTQGGLLHKALLTLERMALTTAHTVITTNDSYKAIACTRGGVSPDRVFVVRSGPDTTRLRRLRPEPSLKNGHRFLCSYLGKMCEQDGVDYLIRVAKILCVDRGHDDILFVLMGSGPAQPALVGYAKELGVAPHCHFTGYTSDEDICRYLSTSDLAVDPDPKTEWSDKSTMNKIMEYMFFGCPVVAFDLREHRVSAQAGAVYAAPNCEQDMADKIEQLLCDEHRRRQMSEYNRARVESLLLWDHSIPHLLKAYDHLFEP